MQNNADFKLFLVMWGNKLRPDYNVNGILFLGIHSFQLIVWVNHPQNQLDQILSRMSWGRILYPNRDFLDT